MQVSLEMIFTFILTPILTAMGTLFALYTRTQNARLNDRDQLLGEQRERIKRYDDEVLPALQSTERALSQLLDLYERMQRQHEWEREEWRERGRREAG